MATKHDYETLEREYITSEISIRQLCVNNSIANWSTVTAMAKKRGWEAKRAAYKSKQFEHDIDTLARRRSMKLAELQDDLIDALRALVYKMVDNLKDPAYIVTPSDFVKLAQTASLLSGGPTSREEINALSLSADLPVELLREIQAAARANGAGAKPVGQSALPIAAGPRQVN